MPDSTPTKDLAKVIAISNFFHDKVKKIKSVMAWSSMQCNHTSSKKTIGLVRAPIHDLTKITEDDVRELLSLVVATVNRRRTKGESNKDDDNATHLDR